MFVLVLLFILVPLVEIAVIIKVGKRSAFSRRSPSCS